MDLLDINVWLALSLPRHRHHAEARQYWQHDKPDRVFFARTTMLGFTRLLMNKSVVPPNGLTSSEAWGVYEDWMNQKGVELLGEPPGIDQALADIAKRNGESPKTWTDAYLAAFAISAGLRIVSFDSDFGRFPGLSFLRLES